MPPHYWTPEQVQRLLHALADQGMREARIASLIMWRTGLRIGETLALEWGDIDFQEGALEVRKTNSRLGRLVPLHGELVEMLVDGGELHGLKDRLVNMSRRTALRHIRKGIEAAGLDYESTGTGVQKAGAYSLRHSAAVHWLNSGVPSHVVAQWLGHSSTLVTLDTYLSMVHRTYTMDDVPD